jgi:bZIP-type transcription factor MBZ1
LEQAQTAMSRPSTLKTEQLDMDSFFDFNQSTTQPSPATASSSRNEALSPFDKTEERQHFSGPSHDYNQYKQQVGLPVGSMANMPMSHSQMYDGYNSGINDMTFDGGIGGWSTGIDMDGDMGMDFNSPNSNMPAMFFPPQRDSPVDSFINPNSIGGKEPVSNVGRLWPGMHSQQAQQAAMRKAAQAQAVQQRQMKLQAQQAHYRQVASNSQSNSAQQQQAQANGNSKRPSHVTEPHVEESISRLLHQMRQNSAVSAEDAGSPSASMLPHIARMKKDEEEMDEDERLLNSEEGKKLSSKERRQLRNKVSARAFRSRRKGMCRL